MVSLTLVFFGPRIFLTASTRLMSLVNSPSILRMMSWALIPARAAGVSSIGDTTVSMPLRLRDLDAESAEAALRLDLQLLVQLRGEIRAVRVERGEHAVDGALDQPLGVDLLDVVLLDDRQDVGERLEVLVVGVRSGTDPLRAAAAGKQDGQQNRQGNHQSQARAPISVHALLALEGTIRGQTRGGKSAPND